MKKYFLINYGIGPCDQEPYRKMEDNKELIEAYSEEDARRIFGIRHKDSGVDIKSVIELS